MPEKITAYSYIRFSTPTQLKGSSLSRQIEKTRKYAEEMGWYLDETLTLQDLGISAFKGQNIEKGALGAFLKMVRSGQISPGSVLIVENLDRLTRGQPTRALEFFLKIIRDGVTIATAMDRTVYNQKTLDEDHGVGRLLQSILILARGNEESRTKSIRLTAAWKGKRDLIDSKKLTAICPHWLRLNADRTIFEMIEDRCSLIREMFERYLDGVGVETIAKDLNSRGVKTWGRSKLWHKSYVRKILSNPAVIGEYQPHHMVDGKREPIGDTIEDYFPAVVEIDTFFRVQRLFQSKGRKAGGRNGTISNLFGHLARCDACRAPMDFVNKGKGPKGYQYLVCQHARLKKGCLYQSVRYPGFEKAILQHCSDLSVADLIDGDDEKKQGARLANLNGQISAAKGQLEKIGKAISNLLDGLEAEENPDLRAVLKERLALNLMQQKEKSEILKSLEDERDKILSSSTTAESRLKGVQDLIERLEGAPDNDETRLLRLKLRTKLRGLISKILIQPEGAGGARCAILFKDRTKVQTLTINVDGSVTGKILRRPRGL